MAITFLAAGSFTATVASATVTLTAPACSSGDILIASLVSKDNLLTTPPAGWTKIQETTNTANQVGSNWWKRADSTDSANTFNFVKSSNNGIFYGGVITAWAGCVRRGSPVDTATATTSANASSDTVTYATFTPAESAGHILAVGFYNLSATTAGSIAGTNPALTNRVDLESATGTTASIFVYSGDSTGNIATGARSHSTTSTVDDVNLGVLFGLVPALSTSGSGSTSYGPITRDRGSRFVRGRG